MTRKFKNSEEIRRYWRDAQRRHRAKKKAQAKQNNPKRNSNETKQLHTYLPTYVPNETVTNETGGAGEG